MSEFIEVALAKDLPDPGKVMLEVDDRLIVLLRIAGVFYCVDDVCTHDGGPLGEGRLCGFELVCPRHGARFDVRNGKALTMPATEDTLAHDVKVEQGRIYIRIQDE